MSNAPEHNIIDTHVHTMPWHMLNPDPAAARKATQPDHGLLHALTTNPDTLMNHMDERNTKQFLSLDLPDMSTRKVQRDNAVHIFNIPNHDR